MQARVIVGESVVWMGDLDVMPRVGELINHESSKPPVTVVSVEWEMTLGPVTVAIRAQ